MTADPGTSYNLTYTHFNTGNIATAVNSYDDPTTTGVDERYDWDYDYQSTAAGDGGPHAVYRVRDQSAGTTLHDLTYDNAGNMTIRNMQGTGSQTLTYNKLNQLQQIVDTTSGASVTSSYTYDINGIRVRQKVGTTTTVYVGGWYEKTGTVATSYYMIGGERVAADKAGTVHYILNDRLGSTSDTIDTAGNTSRQRYMPYGQTRGTDTTAAITDFSYIGQRRDTTSLVYLNNRYHDPQLGTFISVDPLVSATGEAYIYASGNPTTLSDPTGLCSVSYHDGEKCSDAVARSRGSARATGPTRIEDALDMSLAQVAPVSQYHHAKDGPRYFTDAALLMMEDTFDFESMTIEELVAYNENRLTWAGLTPVEGIPLKYILAANGEVSLESLRAMTSAMPVVSIEPEKIGREYDMWCACGNWVQRDDFLRGFVANIAFPRSPGDLLPSEQDLINTVITSNTPIDVPTGVGAIFAIGFGLIAEGYLQGTAVPIDPNTGAYASRNYWQEVAGMPAWPPRTS